MYSNHMHTVASIRLIGWLIVGLIKSGSVCGSADGETVVEVCVCECSDEGEDDDVLAVVVENHRHWY